MKLLISVAFGVCLMAALLHEYVKPQPPCGEYIAAFQGEVSDSVIVNSLSWSDTLAVYQENDIIHFFPMPDGEYKVVSEEAKYSIGIFSREDAKSFLRWALILPLPQGDEDAQYHYQLIVEEKLWE